MSETSSRDGGISAAMSSERIQADENVWTRRLVLLGLKQTATRGSLQRRGEAG